MLPILYAMLVSQTAPTSKASVAYQLTAAKAIATYELAIWRKTHPKADLSLSFSDSAVTPELTNLIRTRLGFKEPVPVLDSQVLTIVFDGVKRPAAKRLSMEAYVFLGSFPKGFLARYLISTEGKEPRVLSRALLERYDIVPATPPKTIT